MNKSIKRDATGNAKIFSEKRFIGAITLLSGAVLGGILEVSVLTKFADFIDGRELAHAKNQVIAKYGDIDQNGRVSPLEKDFLFSEIYAQNGAHYNIFQQLPFYTNGQGVYRPDQLGWIKGYTNSQNPSNSVK